MAGGRRGSSSRSADASAPAAPTPADRRRRARMARRRRHGRQGATRARRCEVRRRSTRLVLRANVKQRTLIEKKLGTARARPPAVEEYKCYVEPCVAR